MIIPPYHKIEIYNFIVQSIGNILAILAFYCVYNSPQYSWKNPNKSTFHIRIKKRSFKNKGITLFSPNHIFYYEFFHFTWIMYDAYGFTSNIFLSFFFRIFSISLYG